jgi:UDP-N-acetylmuramoyl-tripeptide--D-alanyl-D-alanine ligase
MIEVGIDRPGAMADHARLVKPRAALLTTLGGEHLEGFRDVATAVSEEVSLFRYVAGRSGVLFVNLDDPLIVAACRGLEGGTRIGYGLSEEAGGRAVSIGAIEHYRGRIAGDSLGVSGPRLGGVQFHLPMRGVHNARNVLAAVVVAEWLGMAAEDISQGLASFRAPAGRSEWVSLGGIELIGDYYNANPVSMVAALEMAVERRAIAGGRAVACLGEMADLGSAVKSAHRELADEVRRLEIDRVITIGGGTRHLVDALRSQRSKVATRSVRTVHDMAEAVGNDATSGDVILVKGSRNNRLELVWERLLTTFWIRSLLRPTGGRKKLSGDRAHSLASLGEVASRCSSSR